MVSRRQEFGDFQTPLPLAKSVCELTASLFGKDRDCVEPTCGIGSFLEAAAGCFNGSIAGYELNPEYVKECKHKLEILHLGDRVTVDVKNFLIIDGWIRAIVLDQMSCLLGIRLG